MNFVCVVALILFAALPVHGQRVAAVDFATTTNASQLGVSFVTGYEFTVNSPIWITALGAVLDDSPSKAIFGVLPASMQVGLWDSSQNLLSTTTVSNTDPLVGNFNYHTVPAVALSPGQHYTVAGFVPAGKAVLSSVPNLTTPSQITYVAPRALISNGLAFPSANIIGQANGYFGASLAFSATQPVIVDQYFALISLSATTAAPGCAAGARDLTVSAVMQNKSALSFSNFTNSVVTLGGGNTLVSQSWPPSVAASDPANNNFQFVTGSFKITLATCNPFQFFFDLIGTTP